MDRRGRSRTWSPEWLKEDRRQTREWMSKAERNKNHGAVLQRAPARWDQPENWYRKAPK